MLEAVLAAALVLTPLGVPDVASAVFSSMEECQEAQVLIRENPTVLEVYECLPIQLQPVREPDEEA